MYLSMWRPKSPPPPCRHTRGILILSEHPGNSAIYFTVNEWKFWHYLSCQKPCDFPVCFLVASQVCIKECNMPLSQKAAICIDLVACGNTTPICGQSDVRYDTLKIGVWHRSLRTALVIAHSYNTYWPILKLGVYW